MFCFKSEPSSLDLDGQMRKLLDTFGAEACEDSLRRCRSKDLSNLVGILDDTAIAESMLEASFDSVFLTDSQGTVLRVNQATLDKFGYKSRAEIIGKNISVAVGGPHGAKHPQYFRGATSERIELVLGKMRDVTARRSDGSEFPVQVGIKVVEHGDSSGQRLFVAYCHDLTRHKTETLAIEKSWRLQKAIFDSSFDSIFVIDAFGKILQVNKASLKQFGYSEKEEFIGKNISMLVGGGLATEHNMYLRRFHQRGGESSILGRRREVTARRKDGTEFPCQIGIRKVEESQDVVRMVGYIRDITKEKEAMEMAMEKHAADQLLLNMLPQEVVMRLKDDPGHIADHFIKATVLFADIVGFTRMSSQMTPIQVVELLNDLFSRFDECLENYGLNKVKTIGDCYMVTSIPGSEDPQKACAAVCHFALDMVEQLKVYNERNPGRDLNIRIGVNCGPVVAGVVGTKRFLYDIWGDAVNIASRMESTGIPGEIQVTPAITEMVPPDEFSFKPRGKIQVKGVGEMETLILVKRDEAKAEKYFTTDVCFGGSFENLNTVELLSRSLRSIDVFTEGNDAKGHSKSVRW